MADVTLPLALLYTDSQRKIEGATRFQKLAFLIQKEGEVDYKHEFKGDKYGPFSPTLAGSLKALEEKGYIDKEVRPTKSGNEEYIYSLSGKGRRAVRALQEDEDKSIDDVLRASHNIKRKMNDWPLDRLLRYVYKKYPDYTENSELDLADEI